ncbi:MAG: hypothetical protein NT169_24895 [Chloroflexi bacterium]|nr:hypothetical protein [Chloroflexota bacterium]
MSQTPRWVRDIESLARGLPVLLVEGEDDVTLLGYFLGQHAPGWQQRLYLAAANGKGHVVSGVAVHRPDWIGIVDRDEWSPADVQAAAARSPRLHVLPRFCTESYFCDPAELWAALPAQQQARAGDNLLALAGPIHAKLPDWVAHGAMWRVLRDLYKEARLPAKLEDSPVTDEATIRSILTDWHARLAPDPVLAHYRNELGNAQTLAAAAQLHEYIHGKKFFNQVVVQVLDGLFAGKGADDWLQKLRDAPILSPPDLVALFDQILAQLPRQAPHE